MENNFDLKKFLVENRLTTNSRMLNEGVNLNNNPYTPHAFDRVNRDVERHKLLMKIANKLFPQYGGNLENFKPLSRDEREQVYEKEAELQNQAGGINEEGGFYAPDYLEKKYGAKTAQEIEDDIRDNGGPNDWDYFTSLNSAEEVEDFISDLK